MNANKRTAVRNFAIQSLFTVLTVFMMAMPQSHASEISAICEFSSQGWVNVYGKQSVEFRVRISGADKKNLTNKCEKLALDYVDDHVGEGEVAFQRVTTGPGTASQLIYCNLGQNLTGHCM